MPPNPDILPNYANDTFSQGLLVDLLEALKANRITRFTTKQVANKLKITPLEARDLLSEQAEMGGIQDCGKSGYRFTENPIITTYPLIPSPEFDGIPLPISPPSPLKPSAGRKIPPHPPADGYENPNLPDP